MIHPATRVELVSPEVGQGVFATEMIPKGTIVWTQDALDRVFPPESVRGLSAPTRAALERYAHIDECGRFVLCWDAGKLINHSCNPTLRGVGTWFQVARRNIQAGEEITCDYAECNIREALSCRCGKSTCRGAVHADDLLKFADEWDSEAQLLLTVMRSVVQPLWPYLLDPGLAQAYSAGMAPLPSFRHLYSGDVLSVGAK